MAKTLKDTKATIPDNDVALNKVSQGIADDYAHARLGVLYFFSSMNVETDLGFGDLLGEVAKSVTGGLKIGTKSSIDALSGAGKFAAQKGLEYGGKGLETGAKFGGEKIGAKINEKAGTIQKAAAEKTFKEKLTEYYLQFIEKIKDLLRSRFGNVDVGPYVLNLVTTIVTKISAEAGAMVGDIVTGIKGLSLALDNFYGRIKVWLAEREVHLVVGYPKAVVDGINRAMVLSGLEGLSMLAKSGLNIGLGALAAGAQPIVKMVMDGATAIFTFIWRLCERFRIGKFLREAAEHWRNREAPNALHKSPMAFAKWYRSHALAVPILAAMTLNSGICGAKIHFLQMFDSHGAVITQKEWDKGVKMLEDLKARCGEFIRNTKHKFISSDPFVTQLMAHHLTDPADTRNGIWAMIRGQKKVTFNNVKKAFSF